MINRTNQLATTIEIDSWLHDGKGKAIADQISCALQKPCARSVRGYVISARSTGWGDCLLSLVAAWYHAKVSGRTLIIDWRSSLYLSDTKLNAFVHYYQTCNELAGVPVICQDPLDAVKVSGLVYSPIWERYSDNAKLRKYQQSVFYGDIAGNHLSENNNYSSILYQECLPWVVGFKELSHHVLENIHLKPSIQCQVDSFIACNFNKKIIGVHLRCGNKGDIMEHSRFWQDQEQAIERVCIAIDLALEKFGSDCTVFVCSDTEEVEQNIKRHYPDVIVRNKYFREGGIGELHHLKNDQLLNTHDLQQMGEDALIEMHLLAACTAIIRFPPNSYFSFYASAFKRYRIKFSNDNLMPVIEY